MSVSELNLNLSSSRSLFRDQVLPPSTSAPSPPAELYPLDSRIKMDYEALKEQWSEVEERDGVRLSWNVFPSSRMVSGEIFP